MDRAHNTKNRAFAGVMATMMLVVLLFSAFFVAHEAEHECSGEDCPVCACISWCENTLHRAFAANEASTALFIAAITLLAAAMVPALFIARETPVSGKVRMNN